MHSSSSLFLDRDIMTNFNNGNNTFAYDFGRTVWTTSETKMSLSNFSVPFSWYNITAALNNNLFGYTWFDGGTTTSVYGGIQYPAAPAAVTDQGNFFPLTIPDGYYDIPAFNAFLQFSMIKNGHYMIDDHGNYVYFLEIVQNPTTYRVQINSYQLPNNGVPSGWTAGANTIVTAGGASPVAQPHPTPQLLLFPTNSSPGSTGDLFGFFGLQILPTQVPGWTAPSGSAVSKWVTAINPATGLPYGPSAFPAMGTNVGATTPTVPLQYNIQSSYPPLISNIHSICLTCDVVDNPLRATTQHAVSTKVLTTQAVNGVYGSKITNTNFFTTWIPLLQNTNISNLVFQLVDQEGTPILFQDADSNIEILITNLKY